MILVWHIVKKDLYRLRWILALWVVVIAARMGATIIQAGLDEFTYQSFYMGALLSGVGLLPLLSFGMVMGLVHDDPVVDHDAFWITRPISNGQLLAAKALGFVILLFVPVVAALPWWLGHGYGTTLLGRAIELTLKSQLGVAVIAVPLAALSANGSRFVLNVLLLAAGLLGLFLLYQITLAHQQPAGELINSRLVLVQMIWIGASAAIVWFQFFGRRTRRSLVVVGVAAAAGLLVARAWPWTFPAARTPPIATALPATAPSFDPAQLVAGPGQFTAKLRGAIRELKVVAEVPAVRGRVSVDGGYLVRVGEVFMNSMTGELEITLGESAPDFSGEVISFHPANDRPAFYFLVHRGDGRFVIGRPKAFGAALGVSTLRYTHATVNFRPGQEWRRGPDDDFETWARNATLFKLVATASLPLDSGTTETRPADEAESTPAKAASL